MFNVLSELMPRRLGGGFILLILLGMILTHLIVFVIYSQRSQSTEFKVNRDIVARQVINLIQTIENTSPEKQQEMVKALDLPNLKASIDHRAKNDLRFVNASLWQVLEKISDQQPNIQLSFMLPQNDWLNITATIVPTSFGLQSFLFSLEIIVAVAVIFFLWTINRFTKPLHKFTKAAERLGVDLHSEPLPIYGPVAVRATATAMNKMQERIQDLIQARTQMLAAISHDLRTPITRLKLRTQYLDEGELQQKIIKDLDEMEAMISETLAFAREDSRSEQRVNLDIVSMLASLCEDFADTGQDVQYIGPQTRVLINGGSVSLRRVFTNVIDNACKYAGSVTVDLHAEGDEVHILFDDNGPGIANAQLDKVFMPFYRGEHSRSRETGGTGLGLATARDIIRAHGGDIRLSNRPSGGLRVTVVLPG